MCFVCFQGICVPVCFALSSGCHAAIDIPTPVFLCVLCASARKNVIYICIPTFIWYSVAMRNALKNGVVEIVPTRPPGPEIRPMRPIRPICPSCPFLRKPGKACFAGRAALKKHAQTRPNTLKHGQTRFFMRKKPQTSHPGNPPRSRLRPIGFIRVHPGSSVASMASLWAGLAAK